MTASTMSVFRIAFLCVLLMTMMFLDSEPVELTSIVGLYQR